MTGQRVVHEAGDTEGFQPAGVRPVAQFLRADQLPVVMRAAWQQTQDVLAAEDGKQERLRRTADRREDDSPARFEQPRTGGDHLTGIGHVLKHFHAGHRVKASALLLRELLSAHVSVVNLQIMQARVLTGYFQRRLGQVDGSHLRARPGQCLGEDSATATDVQNPAPDDIDMVDMIDDEFCT